MSDVIREHHVCQKPATHCDRWRDVAYAHAFTPVLRMPGHCNQASLQGTSLRACTTEYRKFVSPDRSVGSILLTGSLHRHDPGALRHPQPGNVDATPEPDSLEIIESCRARVSARCTMSCLSPQAIKSQAYEARVLLN